MGEKVKKIQYRPIGKPVPWKYSFQNPWWLEH